MSRSITRLSAFPIAAALVFGLAACGSDDATSADTAADTTPAVTETSGATNGDAALNDADAEFLQGMIAHHEQAVEMAEIALDPTRGAGPEVLDLARRIQAAQEPEIEQMTAWLVAAGLPLTMDESGGHDMSSMAGMMSADDMDALAVATGADFDRMWLEMMIAHHEGAIIQSEAVVASGLNPEVRALAEQIIRDQRAEIAEMQALVDG